MNADDLFYKIGVLTVENDLLRKVLAQRDEEIRKVTTERDELRAVVPADEPDLKKVRKENSD